MLRCPSPYENVKKNPATKKITLTKLQKIHKNTISGTWSLTRTQTLQFRPFQNPGWVA